MTYVIPPPVNVLTGVKKDYVGTIVTGVSLPIATNHVYSDTIMKDSKKRTLHKNVNILIF
jgi:hypothetical protein